MQKCKNKDKEDNVTLQKKFKNTSICKVKSKRLKQIQWTKHKVIQKQIHEIRNLYRIGVENVTERLNMEEKSN